ncbi:MAG: hypothetical protein HFE76_15400 [Firmicutes bacterium]|nr:hypothetical protein [Bacillota bacterium]
MQQDMIKIDLRMPKAERIKRFLKQVDNPHLFEIEGIQVKVSYLDTNRTLQECITKLMEAELNE